MGSNLAVTLFILALNFVVDLSLTGAFAVPLFRASFEHARAIAWRSIIATLVGLLGTVGSLAYIPIIGGEARVWIVWIAVSPSRRVPQRS